MDGQHDVLVYQEDTWTMIGGLRAGGRRRIALYASRFVLLSCGVPREHQFVGGDEGRASCDSGDALSDCVANRDDPDVLHLAHSSSETQDLTEEANGRVPYCRTRERRSSCYTQTRADATGLVQMVRALLSVFENSSAVRVGALGLSTRMNTV